MTRNDSEGLVVLVSLERATVMMIKHVRLYFRQPAPFRRYGAVATGCAFAIVVSGLSTATVVLAFVIAQAAA